MSVDFSRVTALSDRYGNIAQLELGGRVIWSALKEIVIGTLILRPSANISVGHFLYPAVSSVPAYQRINEEVSDGTALYIRSNYVDGNNNPTSKFKLSNTTQFDKKLLAITNVSITVDPTDSGKNDFMLEINGEETEVISTNNEKDFSVSVPTAIDLINEYVAMHGVLPDINIVITSHVINDETKQKNSGISQVYVALTYEGY